MWQDKTKRDNDNVDSMSLRMMINLLDGSRSNEINHNRNGPIWTV